MTTECVQRERTRGDAGFTLVEVVVSLVLLALIMALLAESIRGARRVLGVVERNTAANAVVAARSYLRSALAQAIPGPKDGGSEGQNLGFTGASNSLRFTTAYVPHGQFDGVYRVEIGLERSTAGGAAFDLFVSQTLVHATSGDSPASPVVNRRSKLVANVVAATFAYYGDGGDEPRRRQWQNSWPVTDRLPRLVRIDVRFAIGDARAWYRLQAPLQLAE